MPGYPDLATTDLDTAEIAAGLGANAGVGVPYTAEMIENARADLQAQTDPNADPSGLQQRYSKAVARDFDGDPSRITEMDALVAYLQMLGTLVDFTSYEPRSEENLR